MVRKAAAPPPPPKESRRTLWITLGSIAGGLVVVLAVGILLSVFVFKNGAEKSVAAVDAAMSNYYQGKCAEAAKHIDGPKADIVGVCKQEYAQKKFVKLTMGRSASSGDKGTVYAKLTLRDYAKDTRTNAYKFRTVKTDDGWKLAWTSPSKGK